ncbi:hypothetical protein Gotur_029955 [Gossypium turneri]
MPKPCPKHGLTWDVSCTANVISQIWSYMRVLISVPMPCPRHGLRETFHLGTNAMSQIWSYVGPIITSIMSMPCPRHGLTWGSSP